MNGLAWARLRCFPYLLNLLDGTIILIEILELN